MEKPIPLLINVVNLSKVYPVSYRAVVSSAHIMPLGFKAVFPKDEGKNVESLPQVKIRIL